MMKQRSISLLLIVALIFSFVQIPVNAEVVNQDKESELEEDLEEELEEDLEKDIREKNRHESNKSAKKTEGSIVYVDIDGKDDGDGESWETAYNNIRDAVCKLNDSDIIEELWITKGEYKLPEGLRILKNIKIFGSLEGNETEIKDTDSQDTILEGELIVGAEDGLKPEFIELNNIGITNAVSALEVYDANIFLNNVHIYDNEGVLELSNSSEDIKNIIEIKNSDINDNNNLFLESNMGTADIDISNSSFRNNNTIFIRGLNINIVDTIFDNVCDLKIDVNDQGGEISIQNVDMLNGGSLNLYGQYEYNDAIKDTVLKIDNLKYNNNMGGIDINDFEKATILNSSFKNNDMISIDALNTNIEDTTFTNIDGVGINVNDKGGEVNIQNVDMVNSGSLNLVGQNEYNDAIKDTVLKIDNLKYNKDMDENYDGIYIDGFEKATILNSSFKNNDIISIDGLNINIEDTTFTNMDENYDEIYIDGFEKVTILNSSFKNNDIISIDGLNINIEDTIFDNVCEMGIGVNAPVGEINIQNVDMINGGSLDLGKEDESDAILKIDNLKYNNNMGGIDINSFEKATILNSEFKENEYDENYKELIIFNDTDKVLKNLLFENNENSLIEIHGSSIIEGLKIINNLYDEVTDIGLSIHSTDHPEESYYIKDIVVENKGNINGGEALVNFHFNEKPEEVVIEDIYINNTGEREDYIPIIAVHTQDMDKLSIKNLHVKEDKDTKRGPIISVNGNKLSSLDLIQMNLYGSNFKNLLVLNGDSKVNIINSTIYNNIFEKLIDSHEREEKWYEINPVEIKNSILYGNEIVAEEYMEENIKDTKYINSLVENSKGSEVDWDKEIGIDGGDNIDKDPLFTDERGQLDKDSPARGIGNMKFVTWDKDILGKDRVLDNSIDLGAFEYHEPKNPEEPKDPEDPGQGIIVPPGPKDPEEPGSPELDKEDHFAYLEGYTDGTIRPEENISREAVSAVFFRLLDEDYRDTIRSESNDFKDVKDDRWSNKHISTLTKGEILKGYENGEFRPANNITRGELATIIKRFSNEEGTGQIEFNDIEGHWAEESIKEAASQGWIEGYEDGSFRPDKYMTRAEFVTLINRVLEREPKLENILKDRKEFTDLEEGKWYYVAMIEASNGHKYETVDGENVWTELKDFDIEM